jgi:hypothetical protein
MALSQFGAHDDKHARRPRWIILKTMMKSQKLQQELVCNKGSYCDEGKNLQELGWKL